jgi:hypothetical protein
MVQKIPLTADRIDRPGASAKGIETNANATAVTLTVAKDNCFADLGDDLFVGYGLLLLCCPSSRDIALWL